MILDPKKHLHCARGHQYALDVVDGKIVSGKSVINSCKRYLRDIVDTKKGFYMDWDAAEKYLRNVQNFEHVIGHWPNPKILYEPWQCWVWMNIIGFKNNKTGFRRFRIAHVEIARGNAKSAMASQAVLYFVAIDNPVGNQISTVATKKDQARIVLDSARAMAKKNATFRSRFGVKVLAHTITHPKSDSVVRALSSEHSGLDGLNDVLAVCDELHAMDRDVFEVVYSGMSKRSDSLTLCITTAGQDVHSVGCSQSAYAKKVADGSVADEQFFAAVYCTDEDDLWHDPAVWIKANPNLGVSVDLTSFTAKVNKALVTPADVNNLKIKHLNMWISEAEAFFDLNEWDKCADLNLKIEDFKNKRCRTALDLASHIDLTSFVSLFREDNGDYVLFDKTYLPEDTLKKVSNTLYDDCVAKGYLIKTPGAAINYDFIRKEIEEFATKHKIIECLYDPWNATETAQKLGSKIEMVEMRMNVANLSEPMKQLDALTRQRKIRHNGSPLLRWCLGNVVAKEDHNANVFPRKSHEKLKIDPIVATIMALAGWLQDDSKGSVYETRGIRTL